MKIAIYGAADYGQYIYNEIINNEHSKVTVVFWIDNFLESHEICGLPVYTEKDFISNHKSNDIDAIVIAMGSVKHGHEVTGSLLLHGYNKIYLAFPKGLEPELPVLNEEGYFSSFIKFYKDIKPSLPYIEIPVTHYCNLKCKRCANFSNLVTENNFFDLSKLESYLIQLKKFFHSILIFGLLGGEPLLNPQLDFYMFLIRKYFPKARIMVVTNGLLITEIPPKLIDAMHHCQVMLNISQYPPTRKKLDEIIDFLEKEQIDYEITPPRKEFKKMINFKEKDGEKAFNKNFQTMCYCHTMEEGRIYMCGNISRLYTMQDYFNIYIGEEELKNSSIDLMNDEVDGWEIIKYFSVPTSLCRFCNSEDTMESWQTGQPQKEDWIVY